MWYEFPDQSALFQEQQTFMFGPALFVAPVLEQGATNIEVNFPQGSVWYNAATGSTIAPGLAGRTTLSVTADSIPRCGSSFLLFYFHPAPVW
jgi:alpha-glucosidase (family GH31 glycosyl hydrolase)